MLSERKCGNYVKTLQGNDAFIPLPLPPAPPLKMDNEMHEMLRNARHALDKLEVLNYIYSDEKIKIFQQQIVNKFIEKEALLSSQIEGTMVTMVDLLRRKHIPPAQRKEVDKVYNYVEAINHGLDRLKNLPLCIRLIKEMHAILLRGDTGMPGQIRDKQVRIGTFYPAPPGDVNGLLKDLEIYINENEDYDSLINCALIHYQFVTIHPFIDGNGRMGRTLTTLFLMWKEIISSPLLFSSYYFKKYRHIYFDRLSLVSSEGHFERWIKFFLQGITETAKSALDTFKEILSLRERDRISILEDENVPGGAILLFEGLFEAPVFTSKEIQGKYGLTHQTASRIIKKFQTIGIISVHSKEKKRDVEYIYTKYVKILEEGTELNKPGVMREILPGEEDNSSDEKI